MSLNSLRQITDIQYGNFSGQIKKTSSPNNKRPDITFREFVTFVIDSERQFVELKREIEEDDNELAMYWKDYKGLDKHWEPYSR